MATTPPVRPNYDEIGMVSRIRVETRGGSMEAAERVAFLLLDHARLAGYLEGIIPQGGEYSDHFFNRPNVTRKFSDGPEPWTELGMHYAGRLSFVFEPMVSFGGLEQFGHVVLRKEIAERPDEGRGGWVEPGKDDLAKLADVSQGMIVLDRKNAVTREHSWESRLTADVEPVEASAEAILDNIRRLVNVRDVQVESVRFNSSETPGWKVTAYFTDGELDPASDIHVDLRHAALTVYGECGVEVTHYDSVPREDVEAPFEVTMHVANLNAPTLVQALGHREYRTLVVGTTTALSMAREVLDMCEAESPEVDARAVALSLRIDDGHPRDRWTLTTETVEP